MIYGVLIKFPDGSEAIGIIFPDKQFYAHEPISDTYANQDDFLSHHDGCQIERIGPILDIRMAQELSRDHYELCKKQLEQNYKDSLALYDKFNEEASK